METETETASSTLRMAGAARDLQAAWTAGGMEHLYYLAARTALASVDGATAAGLSLVRRKEKIRIHGATDPIVERIGALQDELEEGPCIEAVWEQPVVHSDDLLDEPRFPAWAAAVVDETGVRSALSVRIFTHGGTLGALCLYSREPHAFDEEAVDCAVALAAHIAVAVAGAEDVEGLRVALDSRTVIGQATGIVMERYGISAPAAFSLLSRVASTAEIKIRQVADELVETGQLRGAPEPG
ncbi:GAF and ANTAR domain-containing protein [Nocardioides marinquilinus]|uniref:GAF and ANTAR domain-containing protein n=1 Tax=Nocardioides marinquilinus TaxID=1210400 RepID=A0ABP9PB85_9ACTN